MNVLVLTFWSYKEGLIQTYTLPYLRQMSNALPIGSKIYLFTLEKNTLTLNDEEKIEAKNKLSLHGIELLSFPYQRFGLSAFISWIGITIRLFFFIYQKKIHTIHSFCTPPSVAGSILAKITGRRFIIDSYEPHAEASVENGDWSRNSFAFKFLFNFEKFLSKQAWAVISATNGMRQYALIKYNVTFERFYVKPACVDLSLFSYNNRKNIKILETFGWEDKIIAVYAGKFGGIYLDQEVFDFLKVAHNYWGDKFRVLLLTNQTENELRVWANKSDLDFSIVRIKFVMHHEIPDYMGLADFGLCPVKPIPTKRYCTPIKNGEYWALGLPIVCTKNISDDSEIIENEQIGSIIHEFTNKSYQKSVEEIDNLLKNYSPEMLFNKIRAIAVKYRSFEISDKIYKEIYSQK